MVSYANTAPRPFVFVLMPFSERFGDIYELGIRPSCESVGAYAERVDEQIFSGTILQRIFNQIARADVIVADLTGQNPNVFYETGYAHALGKRVILLTQVVNDIPFDLKQYPHIIYGDDGGKIKKLRKELSRHVDAAIRLGESGHEAHQKPGLAVLHRGLDLRNGATIEKYVGGEGVIGDLNLQLAIHNSDEYGYRKEEIRFGIEGPARIRFVHVGMSHLKDPVYISPVHTAEPEMVQFIMPGEVTLHPAIFEPVYLRMRIKPPLCEGEGPLPFTFRIFCGDRRFEFPIEVVPLEGSEGRD